jgi:hypothetical protein
MAPKQLILAFGMMVLASPVAATVQGPEQATSEAAPPGGPDTRYCLQTDPVTGTRIGGVLCNTREEWAMLGVDVDEEWADNGVRVENG